MTRSPPYPILLTLLLVPFALMPVTLAHEGGAHDMRDQSIDATFTIQRFGQAEFDFESVEGERIDWSVTTDEETPLYVDLHQHDAGLVLHYNETDVSEVRETFVVPADGTYSVLMQRSNNPPAEVTLTTEGRFAIVGTQGFELEAAEGETAPAPTIGVLLVIFGLVALAIPRHGRR